MGAFMLFLFIALQLQSEVFCLCENKNKCQVYITLGKTTKPPDVVLFGNITVGKGQGIWKYEEKGVVITKISVIDGNNVDCKECRICIQDGGVGQSFVHLGMVVPEKYKSQSYYNMVIWGHWLKKGEKMPPASNCTNYCSPDAKC